MRGRSSGPRRQPPARRAVFGTVVALGVLLGSASASAAATESPAAQSPVTVPSVTVPPVTAPPVTVPSVTVPPVTAPLVTVPPLTLPPVTLPPFTNPPVTRPAVTVPAAPVAGSSPVLSEGGSARPPAATSGAAGTRPSVGTGSLPATGSGVAPAPLPDAHSIAGEARPSLPLRLRRAAVETAQQLSFPIGLALVVAAFLIGQHRVDRGDARVASAGVIRDDDLLGFS